MVVSFFATTLIGINGGALLHRPEHVTLYTTLLIALGYFIFGISMGNVTRLLLQLVFNYIGAWIGSVFSYNIMSAHKLARFKKMHWLQIAQHVAITVLFTASVLTFDVFGMYLGLVYTFALTCLDTALFAYYGLRKTAQYHGAVGDIARKYVFPDYASLIFYCLWWVALNLAYDAANLFLKAEFLQPFAEFWTQLISLGILAIVLGSLLFSTKFLSADDIKKYKAKAKAAVAKRLAENRTVEGDN
jgi:predicted membrane channel-forming protein YqfA (hemolysin III family)